MGGPPLPPFISVLSLSLVIFRFGGCTYLPVSVCGSIPVVTAPFTRLLSTTTLKPGGAQATPGIPL